MSQTTWHHDYRDNLKTLIPYSVSKRVERESNKRRDIDRRKDREK
jgi:hypothetical protein